MNFSPLETGRTKLAEKNSKIIDKIIAEHNGILRLNPAWVARDSSPSGQRLGLQENQYDVGKRGWISERWLASTTLADNRIKHKNEGLSYIYSEYCDNLSLKEIINVAGADILGEKYAQSHHGLARLAKIFDLTNRIAFHYHQSKKDAALVGRNPKEEAYYFPENVDMGIHPETFFGVHPSIYEQKKYDILLPYLVEWNSDLILKHSRAYQLVPGEGFHVPAGVPHAPGTALTIELQEDSDVFGVLQASSGGTIISKDLLFKDIREIDRLKFGERVVLGQLDWKTSGDPYFYENRRMVPLLVEDSKQTGGQEFWIFYNTYKFSGKKLTVKPGRKFTSIEKGVYNIFVWQGQGKYGGLEIKANDFGLDELLISFDKATQPITIENTGTNDLVIFKFFGPDINLDIPMIPQYPSKK